jgi:hypothetical protein
MLLLLLLLLPLLLLDLLRPLLLQQHHWRQQHRILLQGACVGGLCSLCMHPFSPTVAIKRQFLTDAYVFQCLFYPAQWRTACHAVKGEHKRTDAST